MNKIKMFYIYTCIYMYIHVYTYVIWYELIIWKYFYKQKMSNWRDEGERERGHVWLVTDEVIVATLYISHD